MRRSLNRRAPVNLTHQWPRIPRSKRLVLLSSGLAGWSACCSACVASTDIPSIAVVVDLLRTRTFHSGFHATFGSAGFGGYAMLLSGPKAIICSMPPAAWPLVAAKMPLGIAHEVTLGASTTFSLIHLSTVDGGR